MHTEGGCYCGAVRYRIDGEILSTGMCFCRECQHIAGGGPAILMRVRDSDFHYTGSAPSAFSRSDIPDPVSREFCSICGTHVVTRTPRAPGMTVVKAGSLDDPSLFGLPEMAIYLGESYPYHAVPDGVPVFAGRPQLSQNPKPNQNPSEKS